MLLRVSVMNKYITFVWLLMCNDFTGLTTVQMEKYLYMFILFNNTRYLGGIGEERGVQMEGICAYIRRYKMYNDIRYIVNISV